MNFRVAHFPPSPVLTDFFFFLICRARIILMPWSVKFVRSLTWLKKDLSFHFRMDSHQGNLLRGIVNWSDVANKFTGKTFQAAQLTHEKFLTLDHSCEIFFWYLPNWTSTDLWCVVLYVTYSTTYQWYRVIQMYLFLSLAGYFCVHNFM